jgi:cell division septation protein DedD
MQQEDFRMKPNKAFTMVTLMIAMLAAVAANAGSNAPGSTVQVGAFTSPQMTEEQALHWKSLGYKTLLRPAAMPKAGIVYRLYLGSFQSEREAENLVRDLKAKGVSSFSAVVTN